MTERRDRWRPLYHLNALLRARAKSRKVEWRSVWAGRHHLLVLVRESEGETTYPPIPRPIHHGGCPRAERCTCNAEAVAP